MSHMKFGLLLAAAVALVATSAAAATSLADAGALHDRTSNCSLGLADVTRTINPVPLDDEHMLIILPCEDFAYNFVKALYLVEQDVVRPLDLPSAEVMGASTDHWNQIYSPSWDPETQVLGSYYKGGNGNCGAEGEWRWNGAAFELLEIRSRDTCDQTTEQWPVVAP